MKWFRIIIVVQSVIILLLATMQFLNKEEGKNRFEIPVEICKSAKVDRILWTAQIEVRNRDLTKATDQIESDKERVLRNFSAKGLRMEEMIFLPIESHTIYADSTVEGYRLVQKIEVNSNEIERVQKIVDNSSDLLKFKVNFSAGKPNYTIDNYLFWLTMSIQELVQTGKKMLSKNKEISGKKKFYLERMQIDPIFSDDFKPCESKNIAHRDSIDVKVRAVLTFLLK